jgi:intracellular multiplication protein IcmJ
VAFLPIVLGVRRPSDTGNFFSRDRTKRQAQTEKTLERDDFTCRFCGFRARQYQHVIPYEGAGTLPFATACGFCEQCLLLERAGLMGSGLLVWLPEIAQTELHHIMRAVYVARASEGSLAAAAARTQDALLARRAEAKKRVGSDDPLLLATVMHESLDDDEYGRIAAKLEGLRLLPLDKYVVRTKTGDTNRFSQLVNYWRSPEGPYAQLPVEKWADMFKATQSAVGHA